MRRTLWFARRNTLEILRDPISLFFGICFPVVLLLLLTLIDRAIPPQANMALYHTENLVPGISAFSLCFLSLFASMLIAKDRGRSFMLRLLTSPLRSWEFIAGYSLPMIAIGFVQALACYAAGIMLGLPIRIYIFPAVMGLFPTILLYTALGLLFGTVLSEKAVGGICGALLTNLSGWLSGTWFSVEMIGGTFEAICKRLPFHAAAASARLLYAGQWQNSLRPLGITALWSLAVILASVWVFTAHIKKDNR